MRGRPTVYTEAKADALVSALAEGLSAKAACARAGVSVSTLRNWFNRDIGGMAARVSEAQLRASALFGSPITFTRRPPHDHAQPRRPNVEKAAQQKQTQTKEDHAPQRPPDISIRVTWEITPGGAAALADVFGKLDRLGALAIALHAIFPNAGAGAELSRLLKALSTSS